MSTQTFDLFHSGKHYGAGIYQREVAAKDLHAAIRAYHQEFALGACEPHPIVVDATTGKTMVEDRDFGYAGAGCYWVGSDERTAAEAKADVAEWAAYDRASR